MYVLCMYFLHLLILILILFHSSNTTSSPRPIPFFNQHVEWALLLILILLHRSDTTSSPRPIPFSISTLNGIGHLLKPKVCAGSTCTKSNPQRIYTWTFLWVDFHRPTPTFTPVLNRPIGASTTANFMADHLP